MSTSFVVGVFALGAGWCIGVLNSPYPGGIDIPYYQSPLEVPIALIAIALAWALLFPSKKPTGALTACPATAWPHGKPFAPVAQLPPQPQPPTAARRASP